MCLPAAAMAAIAVAETAVSTLQEYQTAKAQNSAISAQLAQTQKQNQEAEVADINARQREARKEQGRIAVAAGEAGLQLSSGSVENMLLDSAMQAHLANSATELNAEHQDQSAVSEANSMFSRVQMPSVIGAGLRLVSAGVTGYSQGASAALAKATVSKHAANGAT